MKSPSELAGRLAAQWQQAHLREQRLLNSEQWPIELKIGKPDRATLVNHPDRFRQHIRNWQNISTGKVLWQSVCYRDAAEPIDVPMTWQLGSPSEWIAAINNTGTTQKFMKLERVVRQADAVFHSLLTRQQHWLEKEESELIKACKLAMLLEPDCASGLPLRSISLAGIDSKFFERHRTLITRLLDCRFDHLPGKLGLESFLGALSEGNHWLLVADLDSQLLPFSQIRVRDNELASKPLPANNILLIENERCLHLLPKLPDTIAILGAGLNLSWLSAHWLKGRRLAYWGDLDTWGLSMLASARKYCPTLTPLLMTEYLFDLFCTHSAVVEEKSLMVTPEPLTLTEKQLFNRLLSEDRGRLEQEFLPRSTVHKTLIKWHTEACT
ncbi:MAG: Wadjet anti-phage system protein JetD domain-containing protein [Endozoicomonas sp.]|uniref:Wadjet anti-phage system protein JetD domain-containing protein n=1 Tax=Endozoicomonas sp. TaxID=1892382 RepID=UPI003D9B2FC3